MENVIAILFGWFIICTLVVFIISDSDFFVCCFDVACAFLISLSVILIIDTCTPTAMDVYQVETALEYTVIDGEKVDSCAIWKEEQP